MCYCLENKKPTFILFLLFPLSGSGYLELKQRHQHGSRSGQFEPLVQRAVQRNPNKALAVGLSAVWSAWDVGRLCVIFSPICKIPVCCLVDLVHGSCRGVGKVHSSPISRKGAAVADSELVVEQLFIIIFGVIGKAVKTCTVVLRRLTLRGGSCCTFP